MSPAESYFWLALYLYGVCMIALLILKRIERTK